MRQEFLISGIQHVQRDVAAVVGDPFIICDQIVENKSVFKGADLSADPFYMSDLDLVTEIVDHFFQRINHKSRFNVIVDKSFYSKTRDIIYSFFKGSQIGICLP